MMQITLSPTGYENYSINHEVHEDFYSFFLSIVSELNRDPKIIYFLRGLSVLRG